jgi:acetyl esterase/lipase
MIKTSLKLDTLFQEFKVKFASRPQLLANTSALVDACHTILSACPSLDVLDVPCNGFRSIVLKFEQLLRFSLKLENEHHVTQLEDIMREISRGLPFLEDFLSDDWDELIKVNKKNIKRMMTLANLISSNDENEKAFSTTFSDVALGFDRKGVGNFVVQFGFLFQSMVISKRFSKKISCLVSKKRRMEVVHDHYRNCKFDDLLKILSWGRSAAFDRIPPFMAHGFGPSVSKEIEIPRQSRWKVQLNFAQEKVEIAYNDDPSFSQAKVKCYLNRQDARNAPFSDCVLVYVHGGGFIACSHITTNNFLFGFAKRLPGLSILSVDVTASTEAKFPIQVQETLDVMLWLQSGDETVKQALGFDDLKKLYFAGDSSGAFTMMQTLMAMNEVNRRLDCPSKGELVQDKIRIPDDVFAFSPALTIVPSLFPSMLLTLKDMVLFPTVMCHMAFSILPDLKDRQGSQVIASTSTWNEGKSIFQKPVEEAMHLLMQYSWLLNDGMFNPIFYSKLTDFEEVNLHFFGSHEDPLLDPGLAFLSKWKGKLTIDILPVLKHGWFYFQSLARVYFPSIKKRITHSEDILVQRFFDTLITQQSKLSEVNENLENFKPISQTTQIMV